MAVLLALLAFVVIVGAALLLRRRPSTGRLAPAPADGAVVTLPVGPLTGADLRRVRFPIVLRGYRPADVDALLARLADQLTRPGEQPAPPTHQLASLGDQRSASVQAVVVAPEAGQQ